MTNCVEIAGSKQHQGVLDLDLDIPLTMQCNDGTWREQFLFPLPLYHRSQWLKLDDRAEAEIKIAVAKYHQC